MRNPRFGWVLAVLVALVSSRANAKDELRPMPLAAELPVRLVLNQPALEVDAPNRGAGAGPTAGWGIEMAVDAATGMAQRDAGKLRAELADYPFAERMQQAVQTALGAEGFSPAPRLEAWTGEWDFYRQSEANMCDSCNRPPIDGAVRPGPWLVLTPRWSFTNDARALVVQMRASYYDVVAKSSGDLKTKLRYTYLYRFRFELDPAGPLNRATNLPRWEKIGASDMARMLDAGILHVAGMMAYDFSPAGRSEGARSFRGETGQFEDLRTYGRQLRRGRTWYWTRKKMGAELPPLIEGLDPLRYADFESDGRLKPDALEQAPTPGAPAS